MDSRGDRKATRKGASIIRVERNSPDIVREQGRDRERTIREGKGRGERTRKTETEQGKSGGREQEKQGRGRKICSQVKTHD